LSIELTPCRHDDLIEEENDIVQEALRRLPAEEQYRRAYRIRIAQQCAVTHTELPRDQWTKPNEVCFPFCVVLTQDVPYLTPIVDQVQAEWEEHIEMDAAIPIKKPSVSVSEAAGIAYHKAKNAATSERKQTNLR
jgi:ubiquinol-cytochrome c reductase subunit 7